MFFEISKLLNILLSPITWIILLLIGTFLFKKKRQKKVCLYSCIAIFLLFTNGLLLGYVKHQMVKEYSTVNIHPDKQYKAAIVMGGFASINKETGVMCYEQDRADRLWEAVRLWKTGVIDTILITGDPTSIIQKDGSSTAQLFMDYMELFGVPSTTFILEQQARNTRENAHNTTEILNSKEISDKECLLITSATHMKRSLKCFAKEGMFMDYYPVNIYNKPTNINHRTFYPSWNVAVEWQELLNEWVGDVMYRMMGYL